MSASVRLENDATTMTKNKGEMKILKACNNKRIVQTPNTISIPFINPLHHKLQLIFHEGQL